MTHNYEESLSALGIGRHLLMFTYDEQLYGSIADAVWHGIFGFCTCGNPDVHLRTLLNTIQKIEALHHTDTPQEFTDEEELWLYLLDKHGFTSHGCSVRCPWMNEGGEHLKCVLEVWEKNVRKGFCNSIVLEPARKNLERAEELIAQNPIEEIIVPVRSAVPTMVHIVMRCEEHSDYPEQVFVDKAKAEAYCRKFNDNPNEYSRSIETMEVAL